MVGSSAVPSPLICQFRHYGLEYDKFRWKWESIAFHGVKSLFHTYSSLWKCLQNNHYNLTTWEFNIPSNIFIYHFQMFLITLIFYQTSIQSESLTWLRSKMHFFLLFNRRLKSKYKSNIHSINFCIIFCLSNYNLKNFDEQLSKGVKLSRIDIKSLEQYWNYRFKVLPQIIKFQQTSIT